MEGDEGTVDFLKLAPPARDDLSHMLERIAVKTLAMVRRRGLLEEEPFDALASVQAEAVQKALPLGAPCDEDSKKLAAFLDGFSLHAGTHVHERNREGLEHLLRYALRPPLSLDRLTRSPDGRVVLSLRRPLHDGTTAVAFKPMELMKRLAAIVPPPKHHTVRYFGVFAASAGIRAKVILKPAERRRRACAAGPMQSDTALDEEAMRRALWSSASGRSKRNPSFTFALLCMSLVSHASPRSTLVPYVHAGRAGQCSGRGR